MAIPVILESPARTYTMPLPTKQPTEKDTGKQATSHDDDHEIPV